MVLFPLVKITHRPAVVGGVSQPMAHLLAGGNGQGVHLANAGVGTNDLADCVEASTVSGGVVDEQEGKEKKTECSCLGQKAKRIVAAIDES